MVEPQEANAKKKHSLARALLEIADIALSDGESSSGDSVDIKATLTPQDIANSSAKQWAKFARKQGLPFRKDLLVDEILSDPRLSAFFEEMRQLGVPVHGVRGLMEAEWNGLPFVSFASFSVLETGSIRPYRFVCTPLSRAYPDLVWDFHLQRDSNWRRHLYPNFDGYELVDGPTPPRKRPQREPGLLGRTPIGREVREKMDEIFAPAPRKLHAVSKDYAAHVASRPFEREAFDLLLHSWAVRGRWLVMYAEESISKQREFMDALAFIKRLVD